ncbi:hypothetical protein D3C78_1690950 [compost metagenome]
MPNEILPEQVQIGLVPRQDNLDAQPLVRTGDGAAEPVTKQGKGGGVQRQLQRVGHGAEIRRFASLVRAPGHLALLGLIQLAGGAPSLLPLAQGQPSPRLTIALPA